MFCYQCFAAVEVSGMVLMYVILEYAPQWDFYKKLQNTNSAQMYDRIGLLANVLKFRGQLAAIEYF